MYSTRSEDVGLPIETYSGLMTAIAFRVFRYVLLVNLITHIGELLAPCFVRQFCGMDETAHTDQKILTKLMNSAAR